MRTHDKMIADQIWVRPHSSEDKAPQKSMGQYFYNFQAPNFRERIEMTYRSLGKQFDWDLEKYRLSKKPADKGNKRRLIKNIVRMIKNPAGYIYWKTYKFFKFTRMPLLLLALSFPMYFIYLTDVSSTNQKHLNWLHIQGAERPESFLQRGEDRPSKRAIPMTFIWARMFSHLPASFVVANPAYKQNYRLYLDKSPFSGHEVSL